MLLPNFIIAGAPKAGTTTLYDLLSRHPEVGMSYIKEPNYFSDGWPNWAQNLTEYEELFAHCAGKKAIGEASPCYLYDPNSARLIKDTLGSSTRIIISLRHPAHRAYSHWSHEHHRYARDTLSFEEAIRLEPERAESPETRNKSYYFHGMYRYVWCSQYADKIQTFMDAFGKENIFVVMFEELVRDLAPTYSQLCEFLEIDARQVPGEVHANIATEPLIPVASRTISFIHQSKQFQFAYHHLPPALRRLVFRSGSAMFWLLQKKWTTRAKSNDEIATGKLLSAFMPDIHRLEELLDRDLSIWYSRAV